MTQRRRRGRPARLVVVPLLAAAFMSGCGSDDEETAFCTDADGVVVDNFNCDEDRGAGLFFWYFGGRALGGGSILRGTRMADGERISASDRAALAARGGFGSSARASGIGRATGSSGSGGS